MSRMLAACEGVLLASLVAGAAQTSDVVGGGTAQPAAVAGQSYEYKLLATAKPSTMEKLNEAARAGFRFHGVLGRETDLGDESTLLT